MGILNHNAKVGENGILPHRLVVDDLGRSGGADSGSLRGQSDSPSELIRLGLGMSADVPEALGMVRRLTASSNEERM